MIGSVYRILHTQSNISYIGSTMDTVRSRWQGHKAAYNTWIQDTTKSRISIYPYMQAHGIESFKCILVKQYDVCDKAHLRAYEQLWIDKFNAINVNHAFNPLRKQQQQQYNNDNQDKIKPRKQQYREDNQDKIKQYREANRDKIKQQQQQYQKTNQDKIKQRKQQYREDNQDKIKQYREANRDKIRQRQQQYQETNQDKIKQRKQQYREANKDKIKQRKQQYDITNKDKIKQRRQQYRNKKAELTIICECGASIQSIGKSAHDKTSKHINRMAKPKIDSA